MILGNSNPSLYTAYGGGERRVAWGPEPTGRPTQERIEQWIGEHPTLSVAAALAMGVTLAWLLKRR